MKKIVLTGGGTAGHITPNLSLIPNLEKNFEIFYLGEKNSLEERLVSKFINVKFIPINAVKFVRKISFKNLLIPFKLNSYIKQVQKILQEIKPDVIFAKGGYVSIPVVLAGSKLNVPILAHESDLSMGLANKIILRKCKIMFTSFRETCISDKCIYSGSPIRDEIFYGNKENARKICGFRDNKKTIMFFGGSAGAKSINDFVFKNIDMFSDYNIIHIVGKDNKNQLKKDNYFQIEYAYNIYDFYKLADVVICRAGSNSIYELLAVKKPMILIPLPKTQSRGDQIENAEAFRKNGYAKVILQENLTTENLLTEIEDCFINKEKIIEKMQEYKPLNANKIILDYILRFSDL